MLKEQLTNGKDVKFARVRVCVCMCVHILSVLCIIHDLEPHATLSEEPMFQAAVCPPGSPVLCTVLGPFPIPLAAHPVTT